MMLARINTTARFSASRPQVVFSGEYARNSDSVDYDVSPDGEHFMTIKPGEQEWPATEITGLLTWFDELKRRVPAK